VRDCNGFFILSGRDVEGFVLDGIMKVSGFAFYAWSLLEVSIFDGKLVKVF